MDATPLQSLTQMQLPMNNRPSDHGFDLMLQCVDLLVAGVPFTCQPGKVQTPHTDTS